MPSQVCALNNKINKNKNNNIKITIKIKTPLLNIIVDITKIIGNKLAKKNKNSHYGTKSMQRYFFESFAKDNHFDPFIANNWYTITRKAIYKRKVH